MKNPKYACFFVFMVVTLAFCLPAFAQTKERWVYAPANFLVNEQADRIVALMKRAKACGYTHFLVTDSKFARIPSMPKSYTANVQRIKDTAKELGLGLVPALFDVGYSNDLLANDPNLAEGLPVKDALFVVKDLVASLVPDPAVTLKDEELKNRKAWGFIDDNMKSEDGVLKSEATKGNARASQRLTLQPYRQYHVSVRVKTQDFKKGHAEIALIADDGNDKGEQLNYTSLKEKPTQEWQICHITFNSLEHKDVNFYFGVWGGHEGTIWWSQPTIEECGLVNILRRPGAPLIVKTEAGKVLQEGVDYEKVVDPHMGNVPYAGEFEPWHVPPDIHVKGLENGTRLRVSFYHPHIIADGQISACVSEPAFTDLLKRQARDVHQLWGADSYMMSHDEWRVMNWCAACQDRHLTPGKIAADNVHTCVEFLHAVAPQARTFVWSDMFDPYHNAAPGHYYLVNGDLTGSWEGLDKNVIIVNWNSGKAEQSLKFFADKGMKQLVAGYYDAPLDFTKTWLAKAKPVPGIIGVMYTTWENNYDQLEAYAKLLDEAGF